MDAADWDARYAAAELIWTAEPNRWVVEALAARPAGSALDLGAGEGRNALWLAARGWEVTAVDFSAEALRKGRALQAARAPLTLPRIAWVHDDVLAYVPAPSSFSAVVLAYLHLPDDARRTVVRRAAAALVPDGVLLVVGHDRTNPGEGVGGPSDPSVLFTADDVGADLAGLPGLEIRRAQRVRRPVDGHPRDALDALVEVVRTTEGNIGRLV
jgi:SAM-dependent methyltransferase